jgi:hypothetical protein
MTIVDDVQIDSIHSVADLANGQDDGTAGLLDNPESEADNRKAYSDLSRREVRRLDRAHQVTTRNRARNQKRLRSHPSCTDEPYSSDETRFLLAIEEYQRTTGQKFPTFSEVLRVAVSIGYHTDDVCHLRHDCP